MYKAKYVNQSCCSSLFNIELGRKQKTPKKFTGEQPSISGTFGLKGWTHFSCIFLSLSLSDCVSECLFKLLVINPHCTNSTIREISHSIFRLVLLFFSQLSAARRKSILQQNKDVQILLKKGQFQI